MRQSPTAVAPVTGGAQRRMTGTMLRLANQTDHAALLDLMEAFNRSERIEMRREVTGPALARLLADPALGCVVVAGDHTAYAVLTWGFDLEFGGRDAFLTEIYVVPERRRGGLGRRLLDEVVRVAKQAGAGAVHLGVYPENEPAVALYRAAGFTKIPRDFYTHR
jgi:ribosomal protein S18 acetylase RimI-like enzyme